MPRKKKLLTVVVIARRVAEYRKAYQQAFGGANDRRSLEEFLADFIEDRISEEVRFATAEIPRVSR
jgi:hypothetical protein